MDYTDWLWIKLIGAVVIVGLVNFIYTLITGKSIAEARRDSLARKEDSTWKR